MVGLWWLPPLFSGAVLVSWLGVREMRVLALRWRILAIPNERSSHTEVVPLGGGLPIVVVNVLAWVGVGFVWRAMTWQHALAFILGAIVIAGISLIDDMHPLSAGLRLGVQSAAAGLFVVGYTYLNTFSLPVVGYVSLGVLGVPLTVIWIVGLINAYNFMDGIDGMLAGQATGAGIGWVAVGLITHFPLLIALGALLAASSCGFLLHNWYPARIFMGDVGSTFLGYSFAALPVIAARYSGNLALAGVLLVWPTIFDSSFTVIRRLHHRESIFVGHRTFLFHRLVAAGWSHSATATLYMMFPALGALMACTWTMDDGRVHAAIAVSLIVACLSLWRFVRRVEREQSQADMQRHDGAWHT